MPVINTLIIFLLLVSILHPQNKALSFVEAETNPFEFESIPIKIGLLPESNLDSLAIENLYFVLKNQPKILEKFELYPYNQFLQMQSSFRIRNLSSTDLVCLNTLNDLFGINHVVSLQPSLDGLILTIRNTTSGSIEFTNIFLDTDSSTGIKDIIKFFLEGVKAVYVDQGALDIFYSPEDAILTVNQTQYPNNSKITLSPGKYFIKVIKDGYSPVNEQIQIEPGQTVYKKIILNESFGKMKFEISPNDTKYIVRSDKDSSVLLEGIGDIPLTVLQEAEYLFSFSSPGYLTENRKFRIRSNQLLDEKIDLIFSYFIIDRITSNSGLIYGMNIITNDGYKYEIEYNIAGELNDNVDVMLYLISKDNPGELFKLNKLSGDVGDDIKVGTGKKIFWDLLGNQIVPQSPRMKNYSFYLEID